MIAKEITKIHEEFYRDKLENLKTFKSSLKGEITLVVSNVENKKVVNKDIIINKIKKYMKRYSLKDTVNLIMETENLSKKNL